MRVILILIVALFLCMSTAVADQKGIPNLTLSEPEITGTQGKIPNTATVDKSDVNGRAVKLDTKGDQEGTQLNPVERRIIIRDTIITNAPTTGGN